MRRGLPRRCAAVLHRRPGLRLALLLTAPLTWLLLAYIGSLAVLFASAFWTTDEFTSNVVRIWNTGNFTELLTTPVYRQVALRSLGVAAAVTVIDAVIARFLPSGRVNIALKYLRAFACRPALLSFAASFESISAVESSAACKATLTEFAWL